MLKNLREQLNAKARELRNLTESVKPEDWTAEHTEKFDALEKEFSSIEAAVERMQRVMDKTAEDLRDGKVADAAAKFDHDNGGTDAEAALKGLFNKFLREGKEAFSAEDWAIVRNTMSTTTPAEGGYLAPDSTVASILSAMKAFGGMRQVAKVINTSNGNTLNYPTSDSTAQKGEIVAQNADVAKLDLAFGVKELLAYKYSSKVVTVPIELLQDANVDMEGFIREELARRLARITNEHYTVGTGSGQPLGVIAAASVGKTGATGQTATVTWEDLIDLEHSVDPAYRDSGTCRWMFNDTTLKALRKLKDSAGRPIWMPGDMEGITGGVPASLVGRPYTINQQVANMAANAKSIAFGDFSKYVIRDVMAMSLLRFTDSVYAEKGQVGFLAFLRTGGTFVDVGGAVKLYQNAAS